MPIFLPPKSFSSFCERGPSQGALDQPANVPQLPKTRLYNADLTCGEQVILENETTCLFEPSNEQSSENSERSNELRDKSDGSDCEYMNE